MTRDVNVRVIKRWGPSIVRTAVSQALRGTVRIRRGILIALEVYLGTGLPPRNVKI